MIRCVAVSSAVALAALTGVQARATFTLTFNGISPSQTLAVTQNSGTSYSNLAAGKFNFTDPTNAPASLQSQFSGFCIQLTPSISSGSTYNDFAAAQLSAAPVVGGLMGAAKANLLAELWGRNYAGLSTATQYAAFQLAVWEIANDTGLNLNGGVVRAASSTVRVQAQTWLSALDGTGPMASLSAITSPLHQNYVVPLDAIPGPGAAGLGVAALALAAGRRRR